MAILKLIQAFNISIRLRIGNCLHQVVPTGFSVCVGGFTLTLRSTAVTRKGRSCRIHFCSMTTAYKQFGQKKKIHEAMHLNPGLSLWWKLQTQNLVTRLVWTLMLRLCHHWRSLPKQSSKCFTRFILDYSCTTHWIVDL